MSVITARNIAQEQIGRAVSIPSKTNCPTFVLAGYRLVLMANGAGGYVCLQGRGGQICQVEPDVQIVVE